MPMTMPMTMPITEDILRQFIRDRLGVEADTTGGLASLQDAGIDSLRLVELLFAIEDHFGIRLPDVHPAQVGSLSALTALVNEAGAAAPA